MATKKIIKDTEVIEAETKEVGFSDLELTIRKPTLGKDGSMLIGGNFEELANQIAQVVDKYKGTVLTDDNYNYVKALKTQFQKLRTGIESKRKDWKKIYLTTPSELLDAMCADLQKIVAEGEGALDAQLEEFDQRRKDELTLVLNEYVNEAVASHNLRPEYAELITLKKEYYNKTQKEEDSADDIELQACNLEKEQKAYDDGVALIRAELEGSMLVENVYIEQLKYRNPMEIVLQIKQDKKESFKIYEEMKAKEESGEKIVIGKDLPDNLKAFLDSSGNDKNKKGEKYGDVRERTLWIRYKKEVAQDLLDFFTEKGIEFKFL